MEIVTCAYAVKLPGGHIESDGFARLRIPRAFVLDRHGVASIPISAFLAALRDSIALINPAVHGSTTMEATLGLLSASETFSSIKTAVATTRVPVFDATMRNINYGYRHLGILHHTIPVSRHGTGLVASRIDDEILAADVSGGHPAMQSYEQLWKPFGLDLKRHFFLILDTTTLDMLSNLFPHPTTPLFNYSPSSNPVSNPSRSVDVSTVVASDTLIIDDFDWLSTTDPFSLFTSDSEASSLQTSTPQILLPTLISEAADPWRTTELDPEPAINSVSPLPTSIASVIEQALNTMHISMIERTEAAFVDESSKSPSLYSLVRNHRSMTTLLVKLGCQDSSHPSGDPSLDMSYVLSYFRWSAPYYKRKATAYRWAEEAANKTLRQGMYFQRSYSVSRD